MWQKKSDKIVVYIGIYLNVRKMDYAAAKIADLFFFSSEFLLLCHSIEDYELIHIGSSLKHEYDADAISYLYLYNAWL